MLWEASAMLGYATAGTDGEVGGVCDLLFDDTSWRLRWIVADTRDWFPPREVILPFSALVRADPARRRLAVDLTVREIEQSPPAEAHPPVSQPGSPGRRDPHLRSLKAVLGHRVQLRDRLVGHIEELLVDDAGWIVRYIRIDTCKWRPGERLLVAPHPVRRIDWDRRLVRFDVGCRELEFPPAHPDAMWIRRASHDTTHSDARPDTRAPGPS
jgi:hypothetical protein